MIEKGDLTMNFDDQRGDLVNKRIDIGGFHLEIYKELNVLLSFLIKYLSKEKPPLCK
jgi:hypothetical protein